MKRKQTETAAVMVKSDEGTKEGKLIWDLLPTQKEAVVAQFHVWKTQCGTYRVYRINSPVHNKIEFGCDVLVPADPNGRYAAYTQSIERSSQGIGYPKYYHTLAEAIQVAENHFRVKNGFELVSSNKDILIGRAEKSDLAVGAVRVETERKPRKESVTSDGAPKQKRVSKPREKVESGPTDAFGTPLNRPEAAFNAALTTKPQKMREICDKIKAKQTFYDHANKLAAAGKIGKENGMFYLIKK